MRKSDTAWWIAPADKLQVPGVILQYHSVVGILKISAGLLAWLDAPCFKKIVSVPVKRRRIPICAMCWRSRECRVMNPSGIYVIGEQEVFAPDPSHHIRTM